MKNSLQNNKNALNWLNSAHFICDVYSGFLNPIMPFIAAKLGFTMAFATLLAAITQICSNMLQPIFGFFADNILKRFFIFWGLILSSVFIPQAASAPTIKLLVLFMILGCLGGSFFHPQSMGFVNFFSGKECSKNMGFFISMGSLGFALGPLLAAYITQTVGLDKVAFTSVIGVLVAFAMFLFVPKLSAIEKSPVKKDFFLTFKQILKNRQMNYLMIVSMMKSLVTNSSCILLPFLWKSLEYSPFYIGFAIFLFVFAGSIGSFLSSRMEKIFGSKALIYFSMWMTFPIMIGFALSYKNHEIFSLFLFALIGFVTMLAQPVTLVWAQKTIPEYKSVVSGFINGFCWGVIALVMSILGLFAEKYGIINVLILLTFLPIPMSYYVRFLEEK